MKGIMLVTLVAAAALLTLCHADTDTAHMIKIEPGKQPQSKAKGTTIGFTCSLQVPNSDLVNEFKWLDPANRTIDNEYISNYKPRFQLNHSSKTKLALVFRNLEESDSGQYTCVAKYDTITLEKSTTLEVYMPVTVLDAPEEQLAKQGQKEFTLKCKVTGKPSPVVTWRRGKVQLQNSQKYIQKDDGLVIKDVQESDDGTYVCEAFQEMLGDIKELQIKLEVITDPKIETTLRQEYNFTEGEPAELQCNATGKPKPQISWIKTKTMLNLTSGFDGKWYFTKVTREDDDIFKCVAENKANTVERLVKVNVQSKPDVVEVVNGTFVVGRNGEISCYVYGNPEPNVTIRKMGNIETNDLRTTLTKIPDPKGRQKTVMATLKITHIERNDDGLYECVARNGIGETIRNLHLTVEFKPTFEKSGLVDKVNSWNQRPVNLTCIASAIPNATITWYYGTSKESLDKTSNRGYQVFGYGWKSILQVTPLEPKYYGPYKCKAVNQHGEDHYEIKLVEAFRPDTISEARANVTTATSITFVFMGPAFNGDLPIKGYQVQYMKSMEDWGQAKNHEWPAGGPYILEHLDPSTKYQLRFAALNEVGYSQWGGFLEVQTPAISAPSEPVLSVKPTVGDQFIKSPFAEKIELHWSIPSDNGMPIDQYTVMCCPGNFVDDDFHEEANCVTQTLSYTEVLSAYMIQDLKPNTLYRVALMAHNGVGQSVPSQRFYKTSDVDQPGNTDATGETFEKMEAGGLSSVVIIYIVVAILIGLGVIIDISCFFFGNTGIIYMICSVCCGAKKKNDDKLGSESRDLITNGMKNKIDIEEQSPMIADGTKKNTAVEYDLKKGTAKTGFVGKDSAV